MDGQRINDHNQSLRALCNYHLKGAFKLTRITYLLQTQLDTKILSSILKDLDVA
jgi:hypothetical protein